ncbi:hypothetical protein A2U01_0068804, partial [Trifolium medium]|nr:hypothetical protein [Trifolium medium]
KWTAVMAHMSSRWGRGVLPTTVTVPGSVSPSSATLWQGMTTPAIVRIVRR